jgi:hypothetical protein
MLHLCNVAIRISLDVRGMKKLIPVTAFTLLCVLVYAQRYKFELAAEAAPSFGLVYGSGAKQITRQLPVVGFETGIGLRANMPKVAGLYTGVYIERKGFVWAMNATNAEGKPTTYKYHCEYHYVKVPLMLNATVGKKVQFFLNAGGYVAALFRIHVYLKELNIDNVNPGGYQYVDAGICGGLGLKVPYKGWVFSFEARNSTGFLKVIKNTETKDAVFNTSTSALIGVAYSFKQWKK